MLNLFKIFKREKCDHSLFESRITELTSELREKISNLTIELEKAKKVLSFYANPSRYTTHFNSGNQLPAPKNHLISEISKDQGELARNFLGNSK